MVYQGGRTLAEKFAMANNIHGLDGLAELGFGGISTCPLNDGADTLFELDYDRAYDHAAETLGAACGHHRDIGVCIEYKQNDPVARCLFGTAGGAGGRTLGYTDAWYAFDVYPKELDTVENFAAAFQITRKLEAITDRIDPTKM